MTIRALPFLLRQAADHQAIPVLLRQTADRVEGLLDPFGFHAALAGLTLQRQDLPSLTREARLEGLGE